MNIPLVSPFQATQVAEAVYKLENSPDIEAAFRGTDLAKHFDFANPAGLDAPRAERFTARTGALEFKVSTGFALLALASTSSDFEGDAIFISRGTHTAYDWLTDANYAITLGASGTRVHSGFNRVFHDMKPAISGFLGRAGGIRRVHCIGHSLGGAIATLVADWLSNNGYSVSLYTFGSPRVGIEGFATGITRKVGKAHIQRVCNSSDPVTMVPVWPYTHAPAPDGECWISRSLGLCIPSHFMDSYSSHFSEPTAGWEQFRFSSPSISIEYGVRILYAESLLELLRISPLLAFSAAVRYATRGLAITLQPGVSLLDQMAKWVETAKNTSVEADSYVRTFLNALIKLLGLAITIPQQITHEIIKAIFHAFVSIYYRMATRATASAASQA